MSEYPSDWRVLPLGEVAEVVGGGTPTRDVPAFWGNNHYWITPSEVVAKDGQTADRSKEQISDLGLQSSGAKLHPPGTILMTSRASIGFAAITQIEICTNQGFQSLRCGNELDNWFALHQIRHRRAELYQLAAGSTFLEVSGSNVRSFPFIVPPLPEQKKIAEILSGIDGAIAKLKCKAQKLDSLQFSLTEEFAQELHDKGEPSALEENAEIRTGVAKNSNNEGDMVEMPYMRVANVQDGYLDLSEIKMISIDRGRIERYMLQKGDVLINEGGDLDKVGRGVIWHEEIKECLHQNHVFAVRCSERLMPEFLSLYLKSSHSKNYFLGCAKQTTNLASINSTQLKSFPIPVPELSVQEKFVKRITSTKDLSFAIATEISGLGAIKKAISGDLLSGRKRVRV
ncbi:restriction endonuclease subunit S [Cyanobium sp. Alchichica 3B3-8F6]|uniref:restriction endonuclease subunit S n=1 Tax=Cyanobium sp. Alchichica 3B3-8F6 TaxID=2823696 RepID=UPI0020CFB7FD|nr:restriction endonuclease subunit S [Cyanobium sp. Alchichica 3B3-8F6]MCP9882830.1 restriction endonuclease subunit S [Cyanobium sp. Alchichica 3B3-8F6]